MTKVDRTAGAMADINYKQLGCDRWNNVPEAGYGAYATASTKT